MKGLNLEAALSNYYDNCEHEGKEKLKEHEIAALVFDDKAPYRAAQVFSQWKKGGVDKANIKTQYINNICNVLGCDPNFLFNQQTK